MPFISVNVTRNLSGEEKDLLKTRLGTAITLISGKKEAVLMIDISGGHSMYFGGTQRESCAYIDVKCYGEASLEDKKALTAEIFIILEEVLGIQKNEAFLSISEFANWGTNGGLK